MTIPGPVDLLQIGTVFWIGLAISAVLAYPIWRMLIRLKSQQNVSAHLESHQTKQGTPTMGGIIIAAGAVFCYAYLALIKPFGVPGTASSNLGLVALILFLGYALIGFIDDFIAPRMLGWRRGLPWKHKIILQVGFAAIAGFMANDWRWSPSVGLCIFLILFFSNAYNFADGMDGLAGSVLLGLGAGMAALAWHSNTGWQVAYLVIPLVAATIPFLFLNAPPAKVFMGDVGSLPVGAVLGLGANVLLWLPSEAGVIQLNQAMVAAILVLSVLMVVEIVPGPLQIFWVKVFNRRLFPFKTPVHHGLQDEAKWAETRVTATFALVQILLSLGALGIYVGMTAGNSAAVGSLGR